MIHVMATAGLWFLYHKGVFAGWMVAVATLALMWTGHTANPGELE